MKGLSLSLLGDFEASIDGQPIDLPTKKAQALLITLAAESGGRHSREKLMALL